MNDASEPTARQGGAAPMEAWSAIASGYDRFVTPRQADLATDALRLAGLRAGDRFLDVAAGTGGLSLPAARLGAKVVATDWSPEMVARFQSRARDEGFLDAEGLVMSCHALDLDDDSFDVTGSQFGVMLVPDQPQALREMVRVTRRGGKVLLIGFGNPAKFEALQFFIGAIRAVKPDFQGLPDDPPPLEFQVSDPEVLRRRLSDAGLNHVEVHTEHREGLDLRSGRDLWDWCLNSNPIPGRLVSDLTEEQKAAVRDELDARIDERKGRSSSALLTADINIAVGIK